MVRGERLCPWYPRHWARDQPHRPASGLRLPCDGICGAGMSIEVWTAHRQPTLEVLVFFEAGYVEEAEAEALLRRHCMVCL